LGIAWKKTRPSGSQNSVAIAPLDHAAIERWLDAGAPEVPSQPNGILAEWEVADESGSESRPDSLPKDPINSQSGDVSADG
jgi:hypothetical protein